MDTFRKTVRKIIKRARTISPRKVLRWTCGVLVVLLLAQDWLLWVNGVPERAIFGLRLNGHAVSRKVDWQLAEEVSRQFNVPLYFEYHGQRYSVTPSVLGPAINTPLLVKRLLAVGHEGSLFDRVVAQDKAFLGMENVPLTGTISRTKVDEITTQLAGVVLQAPVPPTPDFARASSPATGLPTIIVGKDGVTLDTPRLTAYIIAYIFNPPSQTIPVPTIPVKPRYPNQAQELKHIIADARRLVAQPLSVRAGTDILTFSPADLRTMLTVVARPDPSDPSAYHLELRMSSEKLNQRFGDFATVVENHTGAEFNEDAARIAVYAQFYTGKRKLLDIPIGNNLKFRGGVPNDQYVPPLATASGGVASSTRVNTSQLAAAAAAFGAGATSTSTGVGASDKFAYLTFDDGPNDVYHPLILDILKKYHVHATFFLIGKNAQQYPDMVKRTLAEGNVIGNHTLTHAFLPDLSASAIQNEMTLTSKILQGISGQPLMIFRPPYGGVNGTVQQSAKTENLTLFLWSVDPKDWSEPPTDELVRRVTRNVHSGSDILMHSNHQATVDALPKIIEQLQAQGYTFRTLQ